MGWTRPVDARSGQPLHGSKKPVAERSDDGRWEDQEGDTVVVRTRSAMSYRKRILPSIIFLAAATFTFLLLWISSQGISGDVDGESTVSADVALIHSSAESEVAASEVVHVSVGVKRGGRQQGKEHTKQSQKTKKPNQKKTKRKKPSPKGIDEEDRLVINGGDEARDQHCQRTSKRLEGGCNLYDGSWERDEEYEAPYTNATCVHISRHQDCRGNGRPDSTYEAWRWRPRACDLPRFDARAFLRMTRSRTVAFVGDSLARNQYESLLCLLSQVEAPEDRGSKRMQRHLFRKSNVTLIRIWSGWLVRDGVVSAGPAANVTGLWLDQVHKWVELLPSFDVLVLCTGHWWAKPAALFWRGELVGGSNWWRKELGERKMNVSTAYEASVATALDAVISHPAYRGLTVFRTYSVDHYRGGQWNTGGSCTGQTKPLTEKEVGTRTRGLEAMYQPQVEQVDAARKRNAGCSRLALMDVTRMSEFRADAHPGPYRNLDPAKQTKPGPDRRPPPQDCLHWCLPGPVDAWNEMLLELMRRDQEGEAGYGDARIVH